MISFASIAKKFSRADVQRRRRDIFVENPSQKKFQPRQGRHIREDKYVAPDGAWWKIQPWDYNYSAPDGAGKSFLAGFENVSRVVFHAEFFQQRDIFIAE